MSGYDIHADVDKNRLYVVLDGFFTDEQLAEAVNKTFQEIDKLQHGFDIITDISKFKPASTEGAQDIARGQEYAKKQGANRIIRVTGEAVISGMQFQRMERQTHTHADTAASIYEAEKMLD
jgi:hypothetical protein